MARNFSRWAHTPSTGSGPRPASALGNVAQALLARCVRGRSAPGSAAPESPAQQDGPARFWFERYRCDGCEATRPEQFWDVMHALYEH
ncbi:hypothetical protein HYE82_07425 [Streptomyces sp. BR123]|uniref:hypothetical protein n=1 Tax=Streptomyces sp. BR123 TaxID=2749828 RepID=UPI0015C42590|nr:hypothetical protein [Streptomyces sp. BR123]NXY94219.1 hypothetical protein [Streptomyces sp. BR123]